MLSGCAGTLVAWSTLSARRAEVPQAECLMLAAFGAAHVARECSRRAFERKGRSMLAHDLLDEVGGAYVKVSFSLFCVSERGNARANARAAHKTVEADPPRDLDCAKSTSRSSRHELDEQEKMAMKDAAL